jgi:hypothetical protein
MCGSAPVVRTGFGRGAAWALDRRAERLVESGRAKREADGSFLLPRNLGATPERQEIEREMAKARGITFRHTKTGESVSGTLVGSANIASGRYALIEDRLGFSLVP